MKKYLLVAVMAIASLSVSAQMTHYVQGSLNVQNMAGQDARHFGPGISYIKGDGSLQIDNVEPTTAVGGFDALYGFELNIVEGFYWGVEAGIGSSRAYDCSYSFNYVSKDEKVTHSIVHDATYRAYAVRVLPANFGYRHKFNDKWAIDGHVGFGVSYDFGGSFSKKFEETMNNRRPIEDNRETTLYTHEIIDESQKIADVDGYRPFDAYLKVGIGGSYKHIGLDISWQRGFNRYHKDVRMYASNVVVGVRYIF